MRFETKILMLQLLIERKKTSLRKINKCYSLLAESYRIQLKNKEEFFKYV